MSQINISNIEEINLYNASDDSSEFGYSIYLTAQDVLDVTDENNTLFISPFLKMVNKQPVYS